MKTKEKLLISSCLLGELVKYNGSHNKLNTTTLNQLNEIFQIYPFCPEVEGGLPTPRIPCEIISHNPLEVINKNGVDKTTEFKTGAQITLNLCQKYNIKLALLKSNSPSCSNEKIYDGSFSGTKIDQKGVTAKLLVENNITVYNENQIKELLSYKQK